MRRLFAIFTVVSSLVILSACSNDNDKTDDASKKSYKIGITTPDTTQDVLAAFKEGMQAGGYVEGQNTTYVYQDEGMTVQSLIDQKVDMLITFSNGQTEEAMEATKTIPIVGARFTYAVESGYVESLAHPGGNFTGVDIGPLAPQAFQLLIEIFPDIKRIYIPIQTGYPTGEIGVPQLQPLAEEAGIELVVERYESTDDVVPGDEALVPEDIDGLFLFAGSLTAAWPSFLEVTTARSIPSVTTTGAPPEGMILTYGPDNRNNSLLAANMAVQILKGANPADLPIQFGESSITINLQSAQAAGIEIPDSFLNRADNIIRIEG